ncbi:lytic murein transglycosylase B [Pigmentiphaga litoralis]|uniref:lytic murein transglycosylase B n=1 Tax=Pigmentiphaga litoralis TaxID=516702 RepID=UPI001674F3D3
MGGNAPGSASGTASASGGVPAGAAASGSTSYGSAGTVSANAGTAASGATSMPVAVTPTTSTTPTTPSAPAVEVAPSPNESNAKAAFAAEMAQRGLDPADVAAILKQARFSATVAKLVLPAATPSVRSWPRYRTRFVEPRRIKEGVDFWVKHGPMLARTEAKYGVPASIIVSIIGVETFYGRVTGNFRVLDALSTLAFDYPPQAPNDRSPFFREQLAQFLVLCKESGLDPLSVQGSYAGAIGLPQFMPGSQRRFAVDGDGDGKINLLASPDDAIASVANFLIEHGWKPGQPVFLPVRLPADPKPLVDGGLVPTLTWPQLNAAGARIINTDGTWSGAWTDWKMGVIDLYDGPTDTTEYRVAAPNFFAITQYNRSYFYATSVADLAAELEKKKP